MEGQHTADEQSHYEISLTAGQAFVAFVLLMLSLAASFAFGLMLGKGQTDERLVVRKENPVVVEASIARTSTGEIVDVTADEFSDDVAPATGKRTRVVEEPTVVEETTPLEVADADVTPATEPQRAPVPPKSDAAPVETSVEKAPEPVRVAETKPAPPRVAETKPAAVASPVAKPAAERVPHYAQLLSTGDQKTAEGLAVKLINRGFTTAYVERGASEKGAVYRVRVRFPTEQDARSAEPKLREFSNDVWITSR